MVFKEIEQENVIVSQAWNRLYQRLEKDKLLPEKAGYAPNNIKLGVLRRHLTAVTRKIAVAAALAGCLLIGWRLLQKNSLPEVAMQEIVNEDASQTLATMLEDGSIVYLSAQTSLKYPDRFDDDKREVTLMGEAFFEIKNYSARPFIINTDIVEVEVIGTAFKIKSDRNTSFIISVREGEVRVRQKNQREKIIAKAGETVFFDFERLHLKKNEPNFGDHFKCIHFKDELLVDVAMILNMHLDSLQLKVDPSIERRITFTYTESNSVTETAEAICIAMNLMYYQQDSIIYISKE